MSGALGFISGALVLLVATQGTPEHLALVARGPCIPRYHETITAGERVHVSYQARPLCKQQSEI